MNFFLAPRSVVNWWNINKFPAAPITLTTCTVTVGWGRSDLRTADLWTAVPFSTNGKIETTHVFMWLCPSLLLSDFYSLFLTEQFTAILPKSQACSLSVVFFISLSLWFCLLRFHSWYLSPKTPVYLSLSQSVQCFCVYQSICQFISIYLFISFSLCLPLSF